MAKFDQSNINDIRNCGHTCYTVFEMNSSFDWKDLITANSKALFRNPSKDVFKSLDKLKPIEIGMARLIIEHILSKDLAYGTELVSEELVYQITIDFLSKFDSTSIFFTNSEFSIKSNNANPDPISLTSWNPLTSSTFDSGVIAVNRQTCAILWVEEED